MSAIQEVTAVGSDRTVCGGIYHLGAPLSRLSTALVHGSSALRRPGCHPSYRAKVRESNWCEYERSLIQRGNVTIWLSLRQTEGSLNSVIRMMDVSLEVPDHTTLS